MQKNENFLTSLLGAMGVISLLSGIFLDVEFGTALTVAIGFWILAGIVEGFSRNDYGDPVANVRKLFSSLLGGAGVLVLLSAIFIDDIPLEFTTALFIAITFWILSGVIGPPYFVDSRYGQRNLKYNRYSTITNTVNPNNNVLHHSEPVYSPETSSTEEKTPAFISSGAAKKFCPRCGTSMKLNVMTCPNCGEQQDE